MSYNYKTDQDSPNYTPSARVPATYNMDRIIEGVCLHHWGDPNQNPQFQGIVNYLCRAGGNTSAHFVATGTNRQVACIVAPGDAAWAGGTAWANARLIHIEADPRARDEDYDVAAELLADIRSAYGDVPIYRHKDFVATACPGAWDYERLDRLSYTKYSHATDWGKGGNKVAAPVPAPTPTPPAPTPAPVVLFKVIKDGVQVGAYSTEAGAYNAYIDKQATKVLLNGVDVTAKLKALFTTPSPTAPSDPNTGVPVSDKSNYDAEQDKRLSAIEGIIKAIQAFFSSLGK